MRIFKYVFNPEPDLVIKGFQRFLHGGYQNSIPTIWVQVSEYDDHRTELVLFPTGCDYDNHLYEILGTIQDPDEPLVWHVARRVR